MEQIEDIRLELIERADRFPGGWPAATTFERMAETGDANKTRLDQLWKNACLEVEAKKSVDTSRKAAVRGKLAFQSQRISAEKLFLSVSSSFSTLFSLWLLRPFQARNKFCCFKNFVFHYVNLSYHVSDM